MKDESCKIVYKPGDAEIVEKKSRFIAHVAPANSEDEALSFIEKIKKEYWDARHNCSAYRIGTTSNPIVRCSDDGEPSGTAGKPMLEVLTGQDIYNVVVVVTRYFGGTLLGTGGLIRAYTKSTQAGLLESTIIKKTLGQRFLLTCDYTTSGKIQHLCLNEGIPLLDTVYTDSVTFDLIIPMKDLPLVEKSFMEVSNGQAAFEKKDTWFFSEINGSIELLDKVKTS